MSHLTEAGAELPPGRYGSPRRLPVWAAALLVALGVAALVPVAVTVVHRANPAVRGTVTGFTVIDANRVSATLSFHKDGGATATCTLRARNRYGEVVGSAQAVAAGPKSSGVVVKTFPTSDEAVVVEVTGCSAATGG